MYKVPNCWSAGGGGAWRFWCITRLRWNLILPAVPVGLQLAVIVVVTVTVNGLSEEVVADVDAEEELEAEPVEDTLDAEDEELRESVNSSPPINWLLPLFSCGAPTPDLR
jgi:hypothetical protein